MRSAKRTKREDDVHVLHAAAGVVADVRERDPGEVDVARELAEARVAENTEAGTPLGVPASLLAGCRGLEPLASGVTGRRYNRLN